MDGPNLEPSTLLVGLLKRGRGAGYLAALQADPADVHEALLACICGDQTWTYSSFDWRHTYYAVLGLATGLPLEPIRAFIRARSMGAGTHDEIEMACHVLAEMAKRGSAKAAAVLTDEVREGPGWFWAIEVLANADYVLATTPELSHRGPLVDEGLLEQLSDRLERFEGTYETPVSARRQYPQLRWMPDVVFVINREDRRRPDVSDWSVEDLRAAALGVTHTSEALAAARVLGARGDLGVLDTFVAELEADPGTPGIRFRKRAGDYLVALHAERSLPLARRWLNERFPLSMIAADIFEARAEPGDRDAIEQAVLAALTAGDYYRVSTLSSALKRLADPRSAPVMRTVFEESASAFAREEALGGLIAIGNADADDLLVEALWDCYMGCRHLACSHAPLSDRTRTRLQEIRDDPFEEEANRKTAATRLT